MSALDLFMQTFISRRDVFAFQRPDGGYWPIKRRIAARDVARHLAGEWTLGSYLIDEHGNCSSAVFDADSGDGLRVLAGVQAALVADGIVSYLEHSRRGGHLRVLFATRARASHVRRWLLPYCPDGVEFYPKQDEGKGYGSLMRVPFGVHRLSGKRYPFVKWTAVGAVPFASTLKASLEWVASMQQVPVPTLQICTPTPSLLDTHPKEKSFSLPCSRTSPQAHTTIRGWCAQHDPFAVIGQSVMLTHDGRGCCPFGWHHSNGHDLHASFKVYPPGVPGGYCWYCHAWQQGGSVFDFLRYSHHLDARTLWQRIQQGEVDV